MDGAGFIGRRTAPPDLGDIPGLEAALAQGRFLYTRAFGSYNDQAMGVNSVAFTTAAAVLGCHMDLDRFPATHFRVLLRGASSEAAQTITGRLRDFADSVDAHDADTVVVTNSNGTFDSGWLSRDDAKTGLVYYCLELKGSNATVDLNVRWMEILWRIDAG